MRRRAELIDETKTARFSPGGFSFRNQMRYSPLPKRRDHHPARRGCVSVVVSDAGSGAGVGAGGGDGSGWLGLAEVSASGWLPARKLTFSRTVERRRAARSASCAVSASVDGRGGSG
jgi:hypothetical protein